MKRMRRYRPSNMNMLGPPGSRQGMALALPQKKPTAGSEKPQR